MLAAEHRRALDSRQTPRHRTRDDIRGGWRTAKVLRMHNGPELVSQALQRFCEDKTGLVYIPPGCPWVNGYIESFNNRLRKECLSRNHWNTLLEARVVIGDFKHEHNHRHRFLGLGELLCDVA